MNKIEQRTFTSNFIFNRNSENEEEEGIIEGYFALCENETELYEGCFEIISKGAFSDTLKRDVRALWNHDSKYVLGRSANETLEIIEDDKGLFGRLKLPKTSYANDVRELVKNGYVNQCSIGFEILEEVLEPLANGNTRWRINKIRLHEVSVVTFPAYEATTITARKKDIEMMKQRNITTLKECIKRKVEQIRNA